MNLHHSIKTLQPTFIQTTIHSAPETLEWVQANYGESPVNGVMLIVKKESQEVRWK